jgi:hypothetical protein
MRAGPRLDETDGERRDMASALIASAEREPCFRS